MIQPLNVLIVEDSEADAMLVIRELHRNGFNPIWERVQTAQELRAALQRCSWDVILSDYRLPGFNASVTLEIVKQSQKDIPFIVVSGTIGELSAVEMMKAGAHDYVMKDNLNRLSEAVRREMRDALVRAERKEAEREREHLLARERHYIKQLHQLYEAEQQARSAAEASREEAQAANRIKDEFLAVLSHELRSPLNPILGWSRLLQTGKLDEVKTKLALATIERNAKLQAELIEDLLDISRILRGKLSLTSNPINLASTIKAAIETVQLATEAKSIRIKTMLDPDLGLVLGDSTRLQQVIWNLLCNSVKFTPPKGRIEVRLEQVDNQAQITISDNGMGISPEFLPHIFDYFRQADSTTTRKFSGLGLGLAIVRHLVNLHGGTIEAESQGEGTGATFTVKFPLMPTVPTVNQDVQLSELSLDLKGFHILVVDDDTDTRNLIVFLLEQVGARAIAFASADEAFTSLTQSPPDILITDIGMPKIDGYMLMRQIRALPPEQGGQIPAIALTAYAGDINHQQAIQAGFQQHIAKPIEPDKLIQAISTLLSQMHCQAHV
ncbi:response regulator [Anabaena sp. PCC 7108]|uniref:ATP-binding response regulator n=1 Tax=Anabaena sp. PCC 7108 TaxID=163908 RepID=UPI000347F7FD|nr:response regulator [Anabaena sp. PCC 7108]